MTQSELLRFSLVLEHGMEKQAFVGKMFGNLGRTAGNGAGALGWAAGKGAVGAGMAARGVGQAAGATGKFLTKQRQFPGGQMFRNMGHQMRAGYYEGAGKTPPADMFQGPNPMHGPQMPPGYIHDPAGFKAGPGWTSRPSPEPSWAGNPAGFNFKAAPTPGVTPPPKLVPDPESFQAGQPPAPKPTGYLNGAKNLWNNSGTMGRAGMAYGGVTAATAPSNYVNNRKADWQQEHPIMSFMGRTFGGMPNYQSHNYLMPSFLQS